MAVDKDQVTKQILYIAIGVALVVGFLAGIIYSSIQSDTYTGGVPQPQQAAAPQGGGGQGLSPQQASTILALEQRVAANPADVEAWVQLGNTYFDASRYAKAIRAYEKSLELQPGNANVLTDLGVMYRGNGQPEQAVASFDKAIAAQPNHEQSRFNKGIVLMYDMGDIPGAIAAWQGLLEVNPGATASNGIPVSEIIADARKQLGGGQ